MATKVAVKASPPNPNPKGGEVDWEETWEAIETRLEKNPDLSNFRQDPLLVSRIETRPSQTDYWRTICRKAGIPDAWCIDTLIGNPKTVRKPPQYTALLSDCTANSRRYAYQLHRILTRWPVEHPTKVLEVGPGYGGLAELLCRHINVSTYYLVDAPPMQQIQKYYMTEAGFIDKCRFEKPTEKVDLIISINSLGEMSFTAIKEYITLFEQVLVPQAGLMYLIQHRKDKSRRIGWGSYPLDNNWEFEVKEYVEKSTLIEVFGRRQLN